MLQEESTFSWIQSEREVSRSPQTGLDIDISIWQAPSGPEAGRRRGRGVCGGVFLFFSRLFRLRMITDSRYAPIYLYASL